jgi:primosomal protein N' (replication factor Y)
MTGPAPETPPATAYVQVALNLPLRREFTYALPRGVRGEAGQPRARELPRPRRLGGVVTAVSDEHRPAAGEGEGDRGGARRRGRCSRRHCSNSRSRMAVTYGCSLGEALDAMLPSVAKRRGQRRLPHVELKAPRRPGGDAGGGGARGQAPGAVAGAAHRARVRRADAVVRRAAAHRHQRQPVADAGEARPAEARDAGRGTRGAGARDRRGGGAPCELNEHQQQRGQRRWSVKVQARVHRTFLLHGVTGSGKTEVYLRILEEVRASSAVRAIVLVPEISLTPQTVGRFASRFPDVAVLHSGLTDAERGRQWQRLLQGKAKIVVGARSALFAPVVDLGLIVVDEEHETSFKQDSTPRYHARELAIVRGEIEKAVVVLGSATPTLESIGKAKRGIYELLDAAAARRRRLCRRSSCRTCAAEPKEARRAGVVLSRTLLVLMEERLKAKRPGAAVPEPPRLRAGAAVPGVRRGGEVRRTARCR